MQCDYQIAIPSSNRIEIITKKTLPFLASTNIDMSKVDIHVRDEEHNKYEQALAKYNYGKLIKFSAKRGVKEARNHIATYYEKGTHLVCIDDDIEAIEERVDSKTLEPVKDLVALINYGFTQSKVMGYRLWGIHYSRNAFYMAKDTRVNLCIIAGGFFGFVVERKPIELVEIDNYEDIERSFKYYEADGGLLRLDKYTTYTKSKREKGGMQDYRNWETSHDGANYLAENYPQYCDYRVGKDGLPCVKVRDKGQIRRRSTL